jgi:hypothetical protein
LLETPPPPSEILEQTNKAKKKKKKMAFTLLKGFYESIVQETEFSVALLGLENAGKTVRSFFGFFLPNPSFFPHFSFPVCSPP